MLEAGAARATVERSLAKRWREGDTVRLWLAPRFLTLRPGDRVRIDGGGDWVATSVEVDGLAVVVDAVRAGGAIAGLPSDPGRAVSAPDAVIGRTDLRMFELPAMGDQPDAAPVIQLAAGNDGAWRSVPVDVALGTVASVMSLPVEALVGSVEGVLGSASASLADERNTIVVALASDGRPLLSASDDALSAGTNLALVGDELIQFGRAEALGAGRFRLGRLLRGRRGTEWAIGQHAAGEDFQLIEPRSLRRIELERAAVGGTAVATAHGIGDVAPLPSVELVIGGEAMRPLAPCHLAVERAVGTVRLTWIRRSQRAWDWPDLLDAPADDHPERYRLTLSGPGGVQRVDVAAPTAEFALGALPAAAGQSLNVAVEAIGPFALSRPAHLNLIV